MMIERILLVTDDEGLRGELNRQLESRFHVAIANSVAAAQQALDDLSPDLVIAETQLPDGSGVELLQRLQSMPGYPRLLLVATPGDLAGALEAVRRGAFGILPKPLSPEILEAQLSQADEALRLAAIVTLTDECPPCEPSGKGSIVDRLGPQIRKIARTEATVLIQGEPFTGKASVARAIHRLSPRADSPLLRVDCAAIPEHRIEAVLFGGAPNRKGAGVFDLARGGTVLLDEIAALPCTAQDRLVTFLENQNAQNDGTGPASRHTVRIVATTCRELGSMAARGQFREELFHAINLVPIQTPALRERPEDIPLLAEHFRGLAARRLGKNVLAISAACLRTLQIHDWPGNLRELEDVIFRAIHRCTGGIIEPADLQIAAATAVVPDAPADEPEALADAEMRHIFTILARCDGNRTHAARRLDISIRTLRNKLREYRQKAASPGAPALLRARPENCLLLGATGRKA